MKRKPRVAIYVRVSSVGDRVLRSDADQLKADRSYCKVHGYEVAVEYVDRDEKGANAARKNLLAMVDAVVAGELDGIVVYKLDRLSRLAPSDRVKLFEQIEGYGGFVKSTQEATDISTPEGRFAREVFLGIARMEWERKAEEFERQKQAAVARGVHVSGTCPYGYRWVRIDKELQPLELDKDAAKLVKRAFKMRAGKATLGEVQRMLEKESGFGWGASRVKRMLANRVYLGEARQGKHVKPNAHTALVTQGVFDVVQAKFEPLGSAHRSDAKHLLSGIAICSECGYGMRRTRAAGQYFVYRCSVRMGAAVCPHPTSIMAPALEEYVSDKWRERMDGYVIELGRTPVADDGLEDLLAALEAARNAVTPFEDPEYVELIGIEAAKRGARKAHDKVARLEDELAQRVAVNGHGEVPDPVEMRRVFDDATTNEQREYLAGAIEAVTVSRAPRGAALADRVHIHWVGDGTAPIRPSRGRPRKADDANDVEVVAA